MNKNFKKFFLILNFSFIIFHSFPGCKKDLTPVENTQPEIQLTVEDVGVTEAWLRLKIQNPSSKSQVTITRNDSTIQSRITGPSALDTLIYDSELLPNQDYTYTATLITDSRTLTAESQITTMDTTNNDFTWEIFTFGETASSVLKDVFIINENDIWAVGNIFVNGFYDSLGNYIDSYNAVHWNGSEWEMKRIKFKYPYGSGYSEAECVYAFDSNNVIVSSGSSFMKWNGNAWEAIGMFDASDTTILRGYIKKMFGIADSVLYGVGVNGSIIKYKNNTWYRIESGTDNDLHDIWGIYNEKTILITATNKILKITNENHVEEFVWPFSQNILVSIWFKKLNKIFSCGDGAFKYAKGNGWERIYDLPNYFKSHNRGIENNDVFIAGSFGLVAHYNGLNWKVYSDVYNALYRTIDYKNNLMVAVGERNSQAVILMMKRN